MDYIITEVVEKKHILHIDDDDIDSVDLEALEEKLNANLRRCKDSETILTDVINATNEQANRELCFVSFNGAGERTVKFDVAFDIDEDTEID